MFCLAQQLLMARFWTQSFISGSTTRCYFKLNWIRSRMLSTEKVTLPPSLPPRLFLSFYFLNIGRTIKRMERFLWRKNVGCAYHLKQDILKMLSESVITLRSNDDEIFLRKLSRGWRSDWLLRWSISRYSLYSRRHQYHAIRTVWCTALFGSSRDWGYWAGHKFQGIGLPQSKGCYSGNLHLSKLTQAFRSIFLKEKDVKKVSLACFGSSLLMIFGLSCFYFRSWSVYRA